MVKRKVNKSELIREVLREKPSASNAEITAEMSKQGHSVTAALINQAKKHGGKKTKRRSKRRAKGQTATPASPRTSASSWPSAGKSAALPLERMIMAADFSKACGGIDSAIATLNGLKKIADKL